MVWSVDAQALRFVTVASRRQWQQSRKAFDQDILRGKLSDTLAGAVRTEAALIGGAAQSESPSSVRGSLVRRAVDVVLEVLARRRRCR